MAFEVVVTGANKTVATQAQVDTLVAAVQQVFGADTHIVVSEVKKTWDDNKAGAKEVGSVRTVVIEYPPKPEVP